MGNHYHLLVEDPELRLSEGMKWLNLCYGMSYNRRKRKIGPVFQGRFKGVILDPEERGLSVSRYVHLNPVRVRSLGLDKKESKSIRAGKRSDEKIVRERLDVLKNYPWSSYRAYVGLEQKPKWLLTEFVLKKAGGKGEYRKQVEKEVREGMGESPWEEMKWGLVLGGVKLEEAVRREIFGDWTEQKTIREMEKEGASWERIVRAVERVKGEKWEKFQERRGDWGRDMVWLMSQEVGRMKLREIGEKSGVNYWVVSSGIRHLREKIGKSAELKKAYDRLKLDCSND